MPTWGLISGFHKANQSHEHFISMQAMQHTFMRSESTQICLPYDIVPIDHNVNAHWHEGAMIKESV